MKAACFDNNRHGARGAEAEHRRALRRQSTAERRANAVRELRRRQRAERLEAEREASK